MRVLRLADAPERQTAIDQLSRDCWPEFMLHGDNPSWRYLFSDLADVQLLFVDESDALVAVAHTAPGRWDGDVEHLPASIEEIVSRAHADRVAGEEPDVFFAIAAMIDPARRGRGLSHRLLDEMVKLASAEGVRVLLAPVRPTWKSRYPLAPMERYIRWTRDDGSALDPWLRVHQGRGGRLLGISPATMVVERTRAAWSAWTHLAFPESGEYIVPGALQPVVVDAENDLVRYEDPNVWMLHDVPRDYT